MAQAHWSDSTDSSINFIQSGDQMTNSISDYIIQLPDGTYATATDPQAVVADDEDVPVLPPRFQVKPGPRQNQGTRQNGASRLSSTSAETTVVSLLTGQEYVQRPGGGGSSTATGSQRKSRTQSSVRQNQNQTSVLQSNWQQSSEEADISHQQQAVFQGEALQQALLNELALADVKPGEKMYVSIDGITYEIVADDGQDPSAGVIPGHDAAMEMMSFPGGSSAGIGLEELASISAEQETLKLIDYQSMGVPNGGGEMNQDESEMDLLQTVNDDDNHHEQQHQHYVEFVQQQSQGGGSGGGGVTAVDQDGMQIIYMPSEGGDPGNQAMMTDGGGGAEDTKTHMQDLIFSNEQQLQEMVAKGFDLSNCQFIIQESDDPQQNRTIYMTTSGGDGTTQFQPQQLVSMINGSGGAGDFNFASNQSVVYVNDGISTVNPNDVLTMLAEASTVVASQEEQRHVNSEQRLVSESALAPEDYDDGEFDSLKSLTVFSAEDDFLLSNVVVDGRSPSKPLPSDRFLESFVSFVNGTKPETLSSVANSTVLKKPQLPAYVPEFCHRSGVRGGAGRASTNFVRSGQTAVSGATSVKRLRQGNSDSFVSVGRGPALVLGTPRSSAAYQALAGNNTKIVKRKRKDSEDRSSDNGDEVDSDPLWRPNMQSHLHSSGDVTPVRIRGRGRPRGSGGGGRLVRNESRRSSLAINAPAFVPIDLNEAHTYQKGDFVIERKDLYKFDEFPIWKIEVGRLLQKFDPVLNDSNILHKSASVYSSWSGDIRTNFKAIGVEVITATGRKYEIVQVVDKYLPKRPDDSLEVDCLMELFNVYIQSLFSQSIDSSFFSTIEQSQEEYYLGPIHQIDTLLTEAEQAVTAQICFSEMFAVVMEERPFCKITEPNPDLQLPLTSCQATLNSSIPAIKTVKFFGPTYDRITLQLKSDSNKSQEFSVSQHAAEQLLTYHGLHHYKFQLFKKCQEETHFIRQNNRDKSEQAILDECLKNRSLVQQGLRELKVLLENCSIVITVVTKTEDGEDAAPE